MVKLRYSKISSFEFAQAVQKLISSPTHGQAASTFHKISKALTQVRGRIGDEYQTQIVDVFGKRDEAGKIIRPEGEPKGFEPMEEKQEEFLAAQETFGDQEVEIDVPMITLQIIGDIKVSGRDLEALDTLYAGNHEVDNVKSLR